MNYTEKVSYRPHSLAAERNREPILKVLRAWLPKSGRLLEIGSGTGQHATFFASALPLWQWQPSEHPTEFPTLQAGLAGHGLVNIETPIVLDVTGDWPEQPFDVAYSANTAHIMHFPAVEAMFAGVGKRLELKGLFMLYGPFAHNGRHASDSNAEFDASLRSRDPDMGLRDVEQLDRLGEACGLDRIAELRMPANNHILVFHKS